MVVHDLDVFGIGPRPAEADAKLVIHANAPLAGPVPFQELEPVRGRCAQVLDTPGQVELLKFAQRRALDIRETGHAPEPEQRLSVDALEGLDRHREIVTFCVIIVKCDYFKSI